MTTFDLLIFFYVKVKRCQIVRIFAFRQKVPVLCLLDRLLPLLLGGKENELETEIV